jgi:hypothetical protein
MPSASDILLGLSQVANGAIEVSSLWHVVLVATVAALFAGCRPQKRAAAAVLSAPLASVAILAFVFGNIFNGATFSLLAAALAVLAWRAQPGIVTFRSGWSAVLGSVLIVFGTVYPHFLEGASWVAYLYAAPLGAIPCPTLSVVVGAALMAGAFELRSWRLLLALAASFYAVFGVLRLGVLIDAVLLCGALGLLVQYSKDRAHGNLIGWADGSGAHSHERSPQELHRAAGR